MLNSFGLKDHDPGTLMNFISMALLAPFFEEIFWRGQIQDLMLRRFSPAKAIILTSILFTIFHLKFDNTIALFICGLIFGIVYHQTHSLGAVIFLHSFLNLLEFGSKYISVNATDEIFLINYLLFILSVIVVIVITRYLGETVKLQRP
jgi:membrane protease YdiL (CAAX protease family)